MTNRYAKELSIIRQQYASEPVAFTDEPCVLRWPEAIAMLREAGMEAGDFDDLNGAQVRPLLIPLVTDYGLRLLLTHLIFHSPVKTYRSSN